MIIRNINTIRSSLSRSVVTISLIFIGLIMLAWLAVFTRYHINNEKLIKDQIHSTLLVHETNLSKQLSILASSPIFTTFISSGSKTRNRIYTRFMREVLTLKLNTVVGMKLVYKSSPLMKDIESTQKQLLFQYGNVQSPHYVTLNLCYLNDQLNATDGVCQHQWTLFLSKKAIINSLHHINRHIQFCQAKSCYPTELISPKFFGSFPVVKSSSLIVPLKIRQKSNDLIYFVSTSMVILLFLLITIIRYKTKKIVNQSFAIPLANIISSLKKGKTPNTSGYIEELDYLCNQISIYAKQKDKIEVAKMAEQAAHDIRSPLLALKVAIRHLTNISEDERILIRNATEQIDAITHNLLHHNRANKQEELNQLRSILLMPLIKYIIPQKEKELSEKKISIEMHNNVLNQEVYSAFIRVIPSELQRILSNITNNAIDSMSNSINGKLIITLSVYDGCVTIEIRDNGAGIEAANLSKIFEKGISFKHGGNGLGLYHAKVNIEKWQGSIKITSKIKQGTTVTISLPKQKTPQWFGKQFSLIPHAKLVIVDDSESIANLWEQRLRTHDIGTIDLLYFSDPFQFLTWYHAHCQYNQPGTTYLIDHEFSKAKINGLEIINQMDYCSQRFLVTSRAEDPLLQDQCQQLKIKLIPKYFVPTIPIFIINHKPDIILIEQDESLRLAWHFRAKQKGHTILSYHNSDKFSCDARLFNRGCQIFIGEEFIAAIALLQELNFSHVSITTYNSNKLTNKNKSLFPFVTKWLTV